MNPEARRNRFRFALIWSFFLLMSLSNCFGQVGFETNVTDGKVKQFLRRAFDIRVSPLVGQRTDARRLVSGTQEILDLLTYSSPVIIAVESERYRQNVDKTQVRWNATYVLITAHDEVDVVSWIECLGMNDLELTKYLQQVADAADNVVDSGPTSNPQIVNWIRECDPKIRISTSCQLALGLAFAAKNSAPPTSSVRDEILSRLEAVIGNSSRDLLERSSCATALFQFLHKYKYDYDPAAEELVRHNVLKLLVDLSPFDTKNGNTQLGGLYELADLRPLNQSDVFAVVNNPEWAIDQLRLKLELPTMTFIRFVSKTDEVLSSQNLANWENISRSWLNYAQESPANKRFIRDICLGLKTPNGRLLQTALTRNQTQSVDEFRWQKNATLLLNLAEGPRAVAEYMSDVSQPIEFRRWCGRSLAWTATNGLLLSSPAELNVINDYLLNGLRASDTELKLVCATAAWALCATDGFKVDVNNALTALRPLRRLKDEMDVDNDDLSTIRYDFIPNFQVPQVRGKKAAEQYIAKYTPPFWNTYTVSIGLLLAFSVVFTVCLFIWKSHAIDFIDSLVSAIGLAGAIRSMPSIEWSLTPLTSLWRLVKSRPRMLNHWMCRHVQIARNNWHKFLDRHFDGFVFADVQIRDDTKKSQSYCRFLESNQELLQASIAIVGNRRTGRSFLAVRLAEFRLNPHSGNLGNCAIPVFVGARESGDLLGDICDSLAKIVGKATTVEQGWVSALMRTKRLLVIVEDFSDLETDRQQEFFRLQTKVRSMAITSDSSAEFRNSDCTLIFTMPIEDPVTFVFEVFQKRTQVGLQAMGLDEDECRLSIKQRLHEMRELLGIGSESVSALSAFGRSFALVMTLNGATQNESMPELGTVCLEIVDDLNNIVPRRWRRESVEVRELTMRFALAKIYDVDGRHISNQILSQDLKYLTDARIVQVEDGIYEFVQGGIGIPLAAHYFVERNRNRDRLFDGSEIDLLNKLPAEVFGRFVTQVRTVCKSLTAEDDRKLRFIDECNQLVAN